MSTTEFSGHVSAMRADSEFFGAEDFAGRGDVPAQIVKCNRCLDRKACGKSVKEMFTLNLIVDGKPAAKEFWIKPTNRKQILRMYGANVGDWKSKWLWLYVEEVQSPQGGKTLGIRIRDKKDAPVAPARKQEPPKTAAPSQQHELTPDFNAMGAKWRSRRQDRGVTILAEDFSAFIEHATDGLVTASGALKVDSYTADLIAKCVDVINFEMPEQP